MSEAIDEKPAPSGSNISSLEVIRKVLTFELPLTRPWLGELSSAQEEKSRLEANCRDASHLLATRLFDRLLALNCLKLSRQRCRNAASRFQPVGCPRNRLGINLSGIDEEEEDEDEHTSDATRRRIFRVRFICTLSAICFVTYISCLIIFIAYLLLQHDIMLAQMRPTVSEVPNGSGLVNGTHNGCAIKQLIRYDPGYDERRFIEINRRLDAVHEPIRSQAGSHFLVLAMLGPCPFIFTLLAAIFVFSRAKMIRLDFLALVYEPLEERERLLDELKQVIDGLLLGLFKAGHESEHLYPLDTVRDAQLHSTDTKRLDKLLHRSLQNPQNSEFLELLEELHDKPSSVCPLVIHSEWQYLNQRFLAILMVGILFISTGCNIMALIYENILELLARVYERLKMLECIDWHPDGVILRPKMFLAPLDEDDMTSYETYDGSWSYLIYLMFAKERPNFQWDAWRSTLTLFPLTIAFSVSAALWVSVYVLGFIGKIGWLIQIKRQLEWCDQQSRRPTANHEVAQRRRLVMGRLLSVYLNYELYRRQHEPFRVLSNFLLLQASLVVGVFSLALYEISINMDVTYKIFLVLCSIGMIVFFDTYLLLASHKAKLMEEITRMVIKIMAVLASRPNLSLSPALDIWRRQLLTEQDLKKFAATRALGFAVTYQSLIAFNVNIIGVLLILWKAFGGM